MKNIVLFALSFFVFFSCNQDETYIVNDLNDALNVTRPADCDVTAPIYPDITGKTELMAKLQRCFTPIQTYSYSQARTYLYSEIDIVNGQLQTIYTNTLADLNVGSSQSYIDAAKAAKINCEHVFPQSKGAGDEPAQSDMYHIYPALGYVNSARSAYPFGVVGDSGAKWYKGRETVTAKPSNEGEWSKGKTGLFEPRDDKKGDVARSVFYFYTIYNDRADEAFFEGMKNTLLEWNDSDPVSDEELSRANRVERRQQNFNPFILDENLARRLFE